MPIRKVKPRSDRGSLKDLAVNSIDLESEMPPTSYEIRLKKLYEFAETYKDKALQAASGFITTNYIGDKNALPLSAFRIREMVNDIKSKSPDIINNLSQEMGGYIQDELSADAIAYLSKKRIKIASKHQPSFWRASKS